MPSQSLHASLITGFAIASLLGAALTEAALAAETRVVVRAISKDAKFIGSSMGGVRIVLRDKQTGAILSAGVTQGDTGDTKTIMQTPRQHGAAISTTTSAKFETVLDLAQPTLVEVEAYGPLAQLQGAVTVMSSMWIVPGKHVDGGDGWVIEVPGFIVDVLDPPAHQKVADGVANVPIRANVTMMCGCPVEAGGLWDANRFTVAALISRDGKPQGSVRLNYAERASQFEGQVPITKPGAYVVQVYAYDPQGGNTGLDTTTFVVSSKN